MGEENAPSPLMGEEKAPSPLMGEGWGEGDKIKKIASHRGRGKCPLSLDGRGLG
jgi:hypothetical protein